MVQSLLKPQVYYEIWQFVIVSEMKFEISCWEWDHLLL